MGVGEERELDEPRERDPLGLGDELAFLGAEQRFDGTRDPEEGSADAHLHAARDAPERLHFSAPRHRSAQVGLAHAPFDVELRATLAGDRVVQRELADPHRLRAQI